MSMMADPGGRVPYSKPVKLSQDFCSYCGRPPKYTLQRTSRICTSCKLGMILRAPQGEAPRPRDPFLIVDDKLSVQAISHRAELMLGIAEPDCVLGLLDQFLRPADDKLDSVDLALLLELAVAGIPRDETLELRTVTDAQQRFSARVTSCGQPRSALLILTPQATARNASANAGDPAHNGARPSDPAHNGAAPSLSNGNSAGEA